MMRSRANPIAAFMLVFSGTSVYFLTLISMERAFAVLWPIRHRITNSWFTTVASLLFGLSALLYLVIPYYPSIIQILWGNMFSSLLGHSFLFPL